jgi:hypothetical protein
MAAAAGTSDKAPGVWIVVVIHPLHQTVKIHQTLRRPLTTLLDTSRRSPLTLRASYKEILVHHLDSVLSWALDDEEADRD